MALPPWTSVLRVVLPLPPTTNAFVTFPTPAELTDQVALFA
jgi:hypothetical protein